MATYELDGKTYRLIVEADDVTEEVLDAAEYAEEWFVDERIDWEEFIDRMDNVELPDGTLIDMGDSMDSPAIRKIKRHIREMRKVS